MPNTTKKNDNTEEVKDFEEHEEEEETITRLVFDKCYLMQIFVERLKHKHNNELYQNVIEFVRSKFSVFDDVQIPTLYRAFHCQYEFLSQISDIQKNKYHFNAYYIDKFDEKCLKNFGPGFYTLGTISRKAENELKYRISLRYVHETCKCAFLNLRYDELFILVEFKNKFKQEIVRLLDVRETFFDSYFDAHNEHFFVPFFEYFCSLDVKFVVFFSDVYESFIYVYIDDKNNNKTNNDNDTNPFSIIDTSHAY